MIVVDVADEVSIVAHVVNAERITVSGVNLVRLELLVGVHGSVVHESTAVITILCEHRKHDGHQGKSRN